MGKSSGEKNHENKYQGSPKNGEPKFLIIGKIRKPHGLWGEMTMQLITDFPERIKPGKKIFIGEGREKYEIANVRTKGNLLIITLPGFENRESVEKFRNVNIYVRSDHIPKLPHDYYYHHQLIGLRVYTQDGEFVGVLDEIMQTGTADVYVIKNEKDGEKREELIPSIRSVVKMIDLENKKIIISKQEWE